MTTTLAYLGDPDLKTRFVGEMRRHRDEDRVIQGSYGGLGDDGEWRGCAVGCAIRSMAAVTGRRLQGRYSDHELLADIGIPPWLAHLADDIHEGLEPEQAREWPLRFAEAVPVGVDLEPVRHRFLAWLMTGNIGRVEALDLDEALRRTVVAAIDGVRQLHLAAAQTGRWDESAAESAWSAARSAAGSPTTWSVAESAAWSAARSAASAAAWSAVRSVRSAAESAAQATDLTVSAARSAWSDIADELLRLLTASTTEAATA